MTTRNPFNPETHPALFKLAGIHIATELAGFRATEEKVKAEAERREEERRARIDELYAAAAEYIPELLEECGPADRTVVSDGSDMYIPLRMALGPGDFLRWGKAWFNGRGELFQLSCSGTCTPFPGSSEESIARVVGTAWRERLAARETARKEGIVSFQHWRSSGMDDHDIHEKFSNLVDEWPELATELRPLRDKALQEYAAQEKADAEAEAEQEREAQDKAAAEWHATEQLLAAICDDPVARHLALAFAAVQKERAAAEGNVDSLSTALQEAEAAAWESEARASKARDAAKRADRERDQAEREKVDAEDRATTAEKKLKRAGA